MANWVYFMEKLLKILACPVCKRSVRFENHRNIIICGYCCRHYEVKGKVPIMLEEKAKTDIENYLNSAAGQYMLAEFYERGPFLKLYKIIMKITGGSNFHLPIKKRLDSIINKEGENGIILEIGSGNRRLHERVTNVDIAPFENVDVVADGASLPFQDETVDAILILAVLEHTRQPQKVINECYRVLKKAGIIYAEAPFVFRYHSYPTDFWRFSLQGLEELFYDFKKNDAGVCVGPGSGLLTFLTHYVSLFSFSNNVSINSILKGITFSFLFPLKYTDLLLIKNQRAHELAAGVYFMGEKK